MIDARGYACPIPVVMVQREIKSSNPASFEVLVDNRCSVENVTRFAESQGYRVKTSDSVGDFLLELTK